MRTWRSLLVGLVTIKAVSLNAMAMGSGPHPTVAYGIPVLPPATPGAVSFWEMPTFWLFTSVVVAGLLLSVLRALVKK